MHESTDFSKTKLKTMDLEQLIELQKRLENKNNSDEREEGKIRGSFSD